MSQLSDIRQVLTHMDESLATMRKALAESVKRASGMADQLEALWGNGGDTAGPPAVALRQAEDHMKKMDLMLLGAQVEDAHALLFLDRIQS